MKSSISITSSQSANPTGASHQATTQGTLSVLSLADGIALNGSSQGVAGLTDGLLGSHGSTSQASEFNLLATPSKLAGGLSLASGGAGELASLTDVLSTLAPATNPLAGLTDTLSGLPVLGDVVKTASTSLPSLDSLPTLGAQDLGNTLAVGGATELPSLSQLSQLAQSSPLPVDDLAALLPGLPTGDLLSQSPIDPSNLLGLLGGLQGAAPLPALPTLPDLSALTGTLTQVVDTVLGALPAAPALSLPELALPELGLPSLPGNPLPVGPEAIVSQAQGAVGTLQSTVAGLHLLG